MENQQIKVLVIDDDEISLGLAAAMIESRGYGVLLSSDPLKGMNMALRDNPDLIILDMYMPQMDGWHVLARLRSTPATKKTPILMLTAADSVKEMDAAFDQGADGYVTKPIDMVLFHKTMDELLKKKN